MESRTAATLYCNGIPPHDADYGSVRGVLLNNSAQAPFVTRCIVSCSNPPTPRSTQYRPEYSSSKPGTLSSSRNSLNELPNSNTMSRSENDLDGSRIHDRDDKDGRELRSRTSRSSVGRRSCSARSISCCLRWVILSLSFSCFLSCDSILRVRSLAFCWFSTCR